MKKKEILSLLVLMSLLLIQLSLLRVMFLVQQTILKVSLQLFKDVMKKHLLNGLKNGMHHLWLNILVQHVMVQD